MLKLTLFLAATLCACTSAAPQPVATFRHEGGGLAAEGSITSYESTDYIIRTLSNKESVPPWHSSLRTGQWRYWYPSGQLRAIVTYRIAFYTDCCTAGLCRQPYERLVGNITLFAEDGRITYAGSPKNHYVRIKTNCEGGDRMSQPQVLLPDDIRPTH